MLLDLINILTVTHTSAHVASKVFLRVALAGADPLVLIRISPANAKKKESRRTDSNCLPLLITSALLAIWVQPNGLLAELRPYPPDASTEATLNGLLIVAPTRRCRKRRIASPTIL